MRGGRRCEERKAERVVGQRSNRSEVRTNVGYAGVPAVDAGKGLAVADVVAGRRDEPGVLHKPFHVLLSDKLREAGSRG